MRQYALRALRRAARRLHVLLIWFLPWQWMRRVQNAARARENLLPQSGSPAPSPAHLYARLVDLAPDAVFVVNSAGTIVLVNRMAEQMFGYPRDELLGQSIELLLPSELWARHRALRAGYMQAPRTRPMGKCTDLVARRTDGTLLPVEIALAPIDTEQNGITTILVKATVRDISERKARERELVEALVQKQVAEDALTARDRWLALAAHELKSPIASILGFTEMLAHMLTALPIPMEDYQRQRLEDALHFLTTQTARLHRLVDQLLDLSRLEAQRLVLDREEADLVRLAHEQIILAQGIAPDQDILLDAPEEPLRASVDVVRFGQVLANLLANARKYAPESMVVVRLRRRGDQAEISVIDHGPGIPPEGREALFTRSLSSSPQREEGLGHGLGLGLWLSASLVALHGGTIAAHFPEDGGMTVTVTLPLPAQGV